MDEESDILLLDLRDPIDSNTYGPYAHAVVRALTDLSAQWPLFCFILAHWRLHVRVRSCTLAHTNRTALEVIMRRDTRSRSGQGGSASPSRQRAIRQSDIPGVTLEQALRVPQALSDQYAKQPARPLDVAVALDMSPNSGPFRTLCGAAVGYGLTDGGPNAKEIALTELGRRAVSPLVEGDDAQALREAVLVPTVQRQFLERYDGSPLPTETIALNVLETLGVPVKSTKRFYGIIRSNAEKVGFITVIKEKEYIDLHKVSMESQALEVDSASRVSADVGHEVIASPQADLSGAPPPESKTIDHETRRVYIGLEADERMRAQLTQLLAFGRREPVTATRDPENPGHTVKNMIEAMQSASSAVLLAPSTDQADQSSFGQIVSSFKNSSPLSHEIVAAFVLYDERFVVLAARGAELPSDLPDFQVVEYAEDGLAMDDLMSIAAALDRE